MNFGEPVGREHSGTVHSPFKNFVVSVRSVFNPLAKIGAQRPLCSFDALATRSSFLSICRRSVAVVGRGFPCCSLSPVSTTTDSRRP